MQGLRTQKLQANTPKAEKFDWRFDVESGSPEELQIVSKMLDAVMAMASAMERDEKPYTLSLLGVSGVGKTHLAKRLTAFQSRYLSRTSRRHDPDNPNDLRMKHTIRRGGRVEWRTLCDDVRSGDRSMIRDIEQDWFIALDDVGAEYQAASGYTVSVLDQILNARTGRRWTLVTANLTLQQIAEDWDVRIASRMKRNEGQIITVPDTVRDYSYRKEESAAA